MSSQQATSLDAVVPVADGGQPPHHDHGHPGHDNSPDPIIEIDRQDSQSTSSASSPVPAEYEESDFFLVANDSQSSLGVPNLQDMQVTDDECLPPVHRLPNEILISILSRLSSSADQFSCMLTCKRWARNTVELLWHRPSCVTWNKHSSICQTLGLERPYFNYRDFIKRLNLASLAAEVNDGSVIPLAVCNRVERLTLTYCKQLTDTGLTALVTDSNHLLALDISGDVDITESSIYAIARNCRRLQGLNVSNCTKISNESMVILAQNCHFLKRLKLNDCTQLSDESILAFAENCPKILEIDLHQCKLIGNEPITTLLAKGNELRELRLANCELIDDYAFLSLPIGRIYGNLRILDLTSCVRLTDRALEKIIDSAPKLRNLVLAKCRNITDHAVYAIAKLEKNLHYVHLGHCTQITDDAVKKLVSSCTRIRYIDLGCCVNLTDDSVTQLATLPKLKRIGLVKCTHISDESVYALAKANQRYRLRRDADGRTTATQVATYSSSLERVHLSYCTRLTLRSIIKLLNYCPRLTHLSLTGVQAFLREDLAQFCRDAPAEFTEHQRRVFCVFSGHGVAHLRRYLNFESSFADYRDQTPPGAPRRQANGAHANGVGAGGQNMLDAGFEDQEPDVVDDDEGLDDGSEMIIDAAPHLGQNNVGHGVAGASLDANFIPPPPPAPAQPGTDQQPPHERQQLHHHYQLPGHPWPPTGDDPRHLPQPLIDPPHHDGRVIGTWMTFPHQAPFAMEHLDGEAMDVSPARPTASTAPVGGQHPRASSAPDGGIFHAGPSTASMAGSSRHLPQLRGRSTSRVHFDGSENGEGSSRSSPDDP